MLGVVIGGPDHTSFKKVTDTSEMAAAGRNLGLDIDINAVKKDQGSIVVGEGIEMNKGDGDKNNNNENKKENSEEGKEEDTPSVDSSSDVDTEEVMDSAGLEGDDGDRGGMIPPPPANPEEEDDNSGGGPPGEAPPPTKIGDS